MPQAQEARLMLTHLAKRLTFVAQGTVMGRSAVAVVVACVQVPAAAQLAGVEASVTLTNAGPGALPYVWAVTLMAAGALMAASYAARDQGDQRVFEVGSCVLLVAGCVVYAVAVWDTIGPIGALWLLSIVVALTINVLARAMLLTLQVFLVRLRTSRSEHGIDL